MNEDAPQPPEPPSTAQQVAEAAGRALLSAVPLAGGALVEVFTLATTRGRQRRLDEWMEDVAAALQRHGVQIADLAESEGYLDAIGPATRAAIETASEEKRRALRNAVVNASLPSDLDADERAVLMDLVTRLTPTHLRLLRILDDPDAALAEAGLQRGLSGSGTRVGMIQQIAPDLTARPTSLAQIADSLERDLLAHPNLQTMMSGAGVHKRSTTDLGHSLIRFITEPEAPAGD